MGKGFFKGEIRTSGRNYRGSEKEKKEETLRVIYFQKR